MKRILGIVATAAFALAGLSTAAEKPLVYYVQLIRCGEQDKSPEPGSHRVGPKLAERFQSVFRCKSYWEISQQKVEVLPNQSARVQLHNGRDVEIDLKQQGKRRVAAFYRGRMLDSTVEPVSENMTLIGGDRDQTSHWFIVVRRDKPAQ